MKNKVFGLTLIALLLSILACSNAAPVVRTLSETDQQTTREADESGSSQKPLGSVRSNPAPLGSDVQLGDLTIHILGVNDTSANQIVKDGNVFNEIPESGQQFVLVDLSIRCDKPEDQKCSITLLEFSVIDSGGIDHAPKIILAGVDGLMDGGEFYGGAVKTGSLAFIVPEMDQGLILKYDEIFGGEAYLSVY
jgi:hypothetical protein